MADIPATDGDGTTIEEDGSNWWINLDLDGLTDIGAALADADLIAVDDGAGGTNRKSALSRLWTYIQGKTRSGSLWDAVNTTSGTVSIDANTSHTIYTNVGASGLVTYNLPAVGASYTHLRFAVYDTNGIKIVADSSGTADSILLPGLETIQGGYIQSTQKGALAHLMITQALNVWFARLDGEWTVETS